MKQKPIEDRFHNARNDQSLVVIEGFHPLKHALRFGVDILEAVSPDLDELAMLQAVYAPDIGAKMNGQISRVSNDVFERLGPSRPPTGVMAIARRPVVNLARLLDDPSPAQWCCWRTLEICSTSAQPYGPLPLPGPQGW